MLVQYVLLITFFNYLHASNCLYDVSMVTSNNVDVMRIMFDCQDQVVSSKFLRQQVSLGYEPILLIEEKVNGNVVSRSQNQALLVQNMSSQDNSSSLCNELCWLGVLNQTSETPAEKIVVRLTNNGLGDHIDDVLIQLSVSVSKNTFEISEFQYCSAEACGCGTSSPFEIHPCATTDTDDIWDDFIPPVNCQYMQTCIYPDFRSSNRYSFWEESSVFAVEYIMQNSKYYSRIPFYFQNFLNDSSLGNEFTEASLELTPQQSADETTSLIHQIKVFPRKIYLDFEECVDIEIHLIVQNQQPDEYLLGWQFEEYKIFFQTFNKSTVAIETKQTIDEFNMRKIYEIDICNTFSIEDLKVWNKKFAVTTVDFQWAFHMLPYYCPHSERIISNKIIYNESLGKSLAIVHACPPQRRVYFDVEKSKQGKSSYCEETDCFHYDNEFSPVFILVDEVTMLEKVFDGVYKITAIGGGHERDDIVYYSEHEQYLYNEAEGSTLIWAGNQNGYRWLCASGSPCGGIIPAFPNTPYYHLMLQFTNEGYENTYCEHVFNFTIKLHGMPPDGFYPSLFIVLICITIMFGILVSLYILEIKYPNVFAQIRQQCQHAKQLFRLKLFGNKVGLQISTSHIKNGVSQESIVPEHSAKVLQWMDTTVSSSSAVNNSSAEGPSGAYNTNLESSLE